MGYRCPAKCTAGKQRALDLLELSELSNKAQADIALLRGTALLCEGCGCVYVVSRSGTVAMAKFPAVGQRM